MALQVIKYALQLRCDNIRHFPKPTANGHIGRSQVEGVEESAAVFIRQTADDAILGANRGRSVDADVIPGAQGVRVGHLHVGQPIAGSRTQGHGIGVVAHLVLNAAITLFLPDTNRICKTEYGQSRLNRLPQGKVKNNL